jgi:hypothetical protein
MKTKMKIVFAATVAVSAFWLAACQKENQVSPADNSASANKNSGSYVFPTQANMYGKTYADWVTEWWKWNLQFDCAHFPIRDEVGTLESQNQSGPVYFLAGRRGFTLNVTIPADVSIFFPLVSVEENSVPNLIQTATDDGNLIYNPSLTIDGTNIDVTNYKFVSAVFSTTANADLANCFDPGLTGASQDFAAAGYFVMLKPLSVGQHTIHRVASVQGGPTFDVVYNITQL